MVSDSRTYDDRRARAPRPDAGANQDVRCGNLTQFAAFDGMTPLTVAMYPLVPLIGLAGLLGIGALLPAQWLHSGHGARAEHVLLEESFEDGWRDRWRERSLARRNTRYKVEDDGGQPVLVAESRSAASGLWRPVPFEAPRSGRLAWRWKVDHAIPGNEREREKRGDDFAARVFVVFGGEFPSRSNKALCYVWAASEPAGSVYPSPYAANVAMIVVASGDSGAGAWHGVERDIIADYRAFFGEDPDELSGVALMVDTDNTRSEVRAYFDDLQLTAATDPALQ